MESLAAACLLLAIVQFTVFGQTTLTCIVCSGPTSPQNGITAFQCESEAQTSIFGDFSFGHVYKAPSEVKCSQATPGGPIPCANVYSGCCPNGTVGSFMCDRIVNSNCSITKKCASVCCRPGGAKGLPFPPPNGCPDSGNHIILTCPPAGG